MPNPASYVFPRPVTVAVTRRHKPRDGVELDLYVGERVTMLEMKSEWWAIGRKRSGEEGWIPLKHVAFLDANPFDKTARQLYSDWEAATDAALSLRLQEPPQLVTAGSFPFPPAEADDCPDQSFCAARKRDGLVKLCWHDMHRLLRGAMRPVVLKGGAEVPQQLMARWVGKEKQKWHPDRWARLVEQEFKLEADAWVTAIFSLMGQVEEHLKQREESAGR